LKKADVIRGSELSTYSVLNANKVIISEACLEEIESNFSK